MFLLFEGKLLESGEVRKNKVRKAPFFGRGADRGWFSSAVSKQEESPQVQIFTPLPLHPFLLPIPPSCLSGPVRLSYLIETNRKRRKVKVFKYIHIYNFILIRKLSKSSI